MSIESHFLYDDAPSSKCLPNVSRISAATARARRLSLLLNFRTRDKSPSGSVCFRRLRQAIRNEVNHTLRAIQDRYCPASYVNNITLRIMRIVSGVSAVSTTVSGKNPLQ